VWCCLWLLFIHLGISGICISSREAIQLAPSSLVRGMGYWWDVTVSGWADYHLFIHGPCAINHKLYQRSQCLTVLWQPTQWLYINGRCAPWV
jgi:hypothetical protein